MPIQLSGAAITEEDLYSSYIPVTNVVGGPPIPGTIGQPQPLDLLGWIPLGSTVFTVIAILILIKLGTSKAIKTAKNKKAGMIFYLLIFLMGLGLGWYACD
jgi:hypothetical protein